MSNARNPGENAGAWVQRLIAQGASDAVISDNFSIYISVFLASTPWISAARCPPICVVVAGSAGE